MTDISVPPGITTLAAGITWARRQRRLTMRQLGNLAGMSAATVSNLEHGVQRTKKVPALERALRVSLAHLTTERVERAAPAVVPEHSRPREPARFCGECCDMPWRRRGIRCQGCGEAYAAEPEVHAEPDERSNAGYAVDIGGTGCIGIDRGAKNPRKRKPKRKEAA